MSRKEPSQPTCPTCRLRGLASVVCEIKTVNYSTCFCLTLLVTILLLFIRGPYRLISFERYVLERFEPNIYPTLRFSTVRNYKWLLRPYLLPFFGQIWLPEIGDVDVQVFLSQVSKRIAPRTVLSLRHRLGKIFAVAKRWGYIALNPVEGAQVPALQDTRERLALTPQQARALLAELPEPYRTMVLLALLSG